MIGDNAKNIIEVIKDYAFIDGNIYFLNKYNLLYIDNKQVIDNAPKEKEIIIDLVMNFLSDK